MRERMRDSRGLTLIEVIVAVAIFAVFSVSLMTVEISSNDTFVTSTRLADLRIRARRAVERLNDVTRSAVTKNLTGNVTQLLIGDPATLGPSGTAQQRLQFRDVVDTNADLIPTPDEGRNYFVLGPIASGDVDGATCAGIVLLRSSTAGGSITECFVARGVDGTFGTQDDLTSALGVDNKPLCELLVPSVYAPRTAPMLAITLSGRLVTYTMRLNVRKGNAKNASQADSTQTSAYELANDLVITTRVALNQ